MNVAAVVDEPVDGTILEFAHAHADQNQGDHGESAAAVKSGRIATQTGL